MSDEDFRTEPVRGLPERPPEGETVLWQGSPDWRALARHALGLRWVAGYFGALALWRGLSEGAANGPVAGMIAASWYLVIGGIAVGLLALLAWVMAKATVYTVTNRRVAMRIGVALTVTLNLPYAQIESATLRLTGDGTGDICLKLNNSVRLAYLVCWPHVRPWRIGRAEPALRCLPEARRIGSLIAEAANARLATVAAARPAAAARPIAAE